MALKKWNDILSKTSQSLKGKRAKKTEQDPFDIFPEWFTTSITKNVEKDRQSNKEKDDYTTGVDSYLARKKAHKKRTSVDFNDSDYTGRYGTSFSSPPTEQQTVEPTNMGEFSELDGGSLAYNDPVISTKPTPTSIKKGVPRPGPSTFIQTARYNPQTKRLNIAYADGTIFPYENVSPELADRILKKKNYHSPGQTLLDTIFYGHGTTKADQIGDIEEGM